MEEMNESAYANRCHFPIWHVSKYHAYYGKEKLHIQIGNESYK